MPSATQDDVRRLLLALRDRVDALEATVRQLSEHVGWTPPPEPAEPELPAEVVERLERGDRRGAVFALARARGVSRHLAGQEFKTRGA